MPIEILDLNEQRDLVQRMDACKQVITNVVEKDLGVPINPPPEKVMANNLSQFADTMNKILNRLIVNKELNKKEKDDINELLNYFEERVKVSPLTSEEKNKRDELIDKLYNRKDVKMGNLNDIIGLKKDEKVINKLEVITSPLKNAVLKSNAQPKIKKLAEQLGVSNSPSKEVEELSDFEIASGDELDLSDPEDCDEDCEKKKEIVKSKKGIKIKPSLPTIPMPLPSSPKPPLPEIPKSMTTRSKTVEKKGNKNVKKKQSNELTPVSVEDKSKEKVKEKVKNPIQNAFEQSMKKLEDDEHMGKGIKSNNKKQKNIHKISSDGTLGDIKIDVKNLQKLHLKVNKSGRKVIDETIPYDLFHLLTKPYSAKMNYSPKSIYKYNQLMQLAGINNDVSWSKKQKLGKGMNSRKPKVVVKVIEGKDILKRMNVVSGAISAGNNNSELIQEFKALTDKLYSDHKIDKKTYASLLSSFNI